MAKLVVGCGYLGGRVARRWLAQGDAVVALTRSVEHVAELAEEGIAPLVADVTRPETLVGLPPATTVLYAVPPGPADAFAAAIDPVRAVLDALPHPPERFILISSTGVYGEGHADWVDEQTPCHPERETAKALWELEESLRRHRLADRGIVLRLAGIYGPDRIPKMAALAAGEMLSVAADATVNLVHVDDAVAAVLAAERWAHPPAVYNVADGEPVGRREFYRTAAELAGWPQPKFVEPADPQTARRGLGNKRVRAVKVQEELNCALIYPSYREGLAAILRV